MSTLRITNIEAKADPSSPTVDEKIKLTNSNGDILVHIDGKTSGITTIGINTTAGNIKFDQNSNVVVTGIITATKFVGTIEPTTLTVGGDLTIPDKIVHTGDTNTAIRFPAADTFTVETGGSERLRITSAGALNLSSPSSTVAAGLLNVPNGSRVTTTSGVYVTGNGGIVDMARYEMISKCITSFPAYNNAICAINGAPLYITDSRNAWAVYSALPNYLLGTLTHDCINNTSFTVTLACTMTVFLGRSNGWNSVSLSGWNLIETNTGINPFGGDTRLYVKTLNAGTHTLDNDSAMYFFSL